MTRKILKRTVELLLGISIVIFLIADYCDHIGCRYLVEFIVPQQPFKALVVIALIIIAYRLIGGPAKDYSRNFYRILVWLFGDPANKAKQ